MGHGFNDPRFSFTERFAYSLMSLFLFASTSFSQAATMTVDTIDGNIINKDYKCSISEAIVNANVNNELYTDCQIEGSGPLIIELAVDVILTANVLTNNGSNGTWSIDSTLTLDGLGHSLSRDAGLSCNLNGTIEPSEFRLLNILSGGILTLQNITLANGCADGDTTNKASGGAVFNLGSLTVINSTFDSNKAHMAGGAIYNNSGATIPLIKNSTLSTSTAGDWGGGVYNAGTITTISNSTLSDNFADYGGGLFNNGALSECLNSTFSSNSATLYGGGVYNFSTLTSISNSTFSGNSGGAGGGIMVSNGTVGTLENSIFTNSTSGGDCATGSGGTITAGIKNLSSDNSCPGDTGNVSNFDPTLRDNGCSFPSPNGCVQTHALLAGSNALDKAVSGADNGQRELGLFNGRDIGSFERQKLDYSDCTTELKVNGFTTTISSPAQLHLAIACSNYNGHNNPDTIKLAANIILTGDGSSTSTGIFLADGKNGTPNIFSTIIIDGQGHSISRNDTLICNMNGINDTGEFRLLHVDINGDLSLQNIFLGNGCADGNSLDNDGGGGTVFNLGTLKVTNSTFDGNHAMWWGGAILNRGINATISDISNSTLSNNSAFMGGGISNEGSIIKILSSTFSGNLAQNIGGGISNSGPLTKISNSTFSGNSATYWGGGVFTSAPLTTLINSTFSGNSASADHGGGLKVYKSTVGTLMNTIFSNTISGGDCSFIDSDIITTASNNLSNDNTCPGDIGDVTRFDATLKDNDCITPSPIGCVKTHALFSGSNAIDATVDGTDIDQRGFAAKGIRDIGAYEFILPRCVPYAPKEKLLMICW